ncbi:MAG: hypothetical protein ACJ8KF_00010 [Chthoniobacterales bacterium]
MNWKLQKLHPPKPPKKKWVRAHWRWNYEIHQWEWVLGHWSK